jgi:hypothetical protein
VERQQVLARFVLVVVVVLVLLALMAQTKRHQV